MKGRLLIILVVVAAVGALLFWKEVLAALNGMSPIESMKFIWTFVLHVSVGTAVAYILYTLPEIIGPWIKTLRWKQRSIRRGRWQKAPAAGGWQSGPNAYWGRTGPRLSQKDLLMLSLIQGRPVDPPRLDLMPHPEAVEDETLNVQL